MRRACSPWGAALLALPLLACGLESDAQSREEAALLTGGDARVGKELTREYGCDACHTIPGVPGADRQVGPPLAGISGRMYIAGVLANNPENLVRWIQDPPAVDSLTAMPNVGVSASEARHLAAYLYTLK